MAVGSSHLLLMDPNSVYQKYFLCGDHFNDRSFTNMNKQRLKNDAIPTINISPFQSDALINEYDLNITKWKGNSKDSMLKVLT